MKKEQIKSLLLRWRDQTVPAASARVAEMFKSVDRVLLEYADKAESNKIQVQFFEAQREIWLKQDQVSSQFHDTLHHELFNFTRQEKDPSDADKGALSLVSKDDFERSLALQTISEQAIKHNYDLYYALSQRLGVTVGGRPVPFKSLPAGPHQLSSVFERATSQLNIERPALLALFTLFEREVIRKSLDWHDALNRGLQQLGILPNLKYEVAKNPKSAAQPAAAEEEAEEEAAQPEAAYASAQVGAGARAGGQRPSAGAQAAAATAGAQAQRAPDRGHGGDVELGDEILSRIRELLSVQRARQASDAGGVPRPEPLHPAPAPIIAEAIESMQARGVGALPETHVTDPGVRQATVSRGILDRVREALSLQREQVKSTVGRNRLSHLDEDVIDIVGMLFEVMLNDKRLGNTVKALLSHLHTPYLKVAIRDRAFLDRREHPARRLFDQMVEAGSRWVDERDLTAGIYPKLQGTVQRISRAKDHPVQLFQELEDKLATEIKQLAERQRVREARTVESEKGIARLEDARETAMRACQKLFEIPGAPNVFQSFVTGPWADYLTLLYLRSDGNTDAGAWRGAVVLGERLHGFVTELLAGKPPAAPDLKQLKDEVARRLGDLIPQYQTEVERLFALFAGEIADAETAPAASRPAAGPKPTEPAAAAEIELSPNGQTLAGRLPDLPPGTWIVFHGEDEADQVVKLSWYNSKTERFLFVDQTGAKALAMALPELADAIDRERAHVLHASGTSYVESSLKRAMEALQKRA